MVLLIHAKMEEHVEHWQVDDAFVSARKNFMEITVKKVKKFIAVIIVSK